MSVLQFPQALRQAPPEPVDHKLGEYSVGVDGPTIVLIGGVHGNEPAGVVAIRRVLAELHARRLPLRGKVVGLLGNPGALDRKRRFMTRDLNRGWSRPTLSALSHGYGSGREDEAQRGLLHALAPFLDDPKGSPITFLDLHSTSGPGAPFACIADVKRNYTVARALPIPVILGIEEMLDGSLLGFLCDLGHAGIAIEGGQNDDPSTVLRHEAAAWIAMVAAGALREADVNDIETHRRGLGRTAKRLPRFVEVRHRHATTLDDGFVMEPGFSSFEPVRAGEVLARDRRGEIRAVEDGFVLMPRYQVQGDDGFFLAKEMSPNALRLLSGLRRLPARALSALLPHVTRDRNAPDEFLVDAPRVGTIRLLQRVGFRRVRPAENGQVHVSRRRPDELGVEPFAYEPATR